MATKYQRKTDRQTTPAARYAWKLGAIKRSRKLWKSPQRSADLIAQRKEAQNARAGRASR